MARILLGNQTSQAVHSGLLAFEFFAHALAYSNEEKKDQTNRDLLRSSSRFQIERVLTKLGRSAAATKQENVFGSKGPMLFSLLGN